MLPVAASTVRRPLAQVSGNSPPRHLIAAPSKVQPVRSTGASLSSVSASGQIQSSPLVSSIGSVSITGCMFVSLLGGWRGHFEEVANKAHFAGGEVPAIGGHARLGVGVKAGRADHADIGRTQRGA